MVLPLVKRYLLAFQRHRWVGLTGFTVVLGVSGVMAALQSAPTSIYRTTGVLTYNAPPETFSATGTSLKQQGQAMTREMLTSSYVLQQAVDILGEQGIQTEARELRRRAKVTTNKDPEVQAEPRSKEEEEEKLPLRVDVVYEDADSDRSKAIATALMAAMIDQSLQFNRQQLNSIIDNLNQLLPTVTQELREAERNLEQYIRQEGTAIQAAESGSLVAAITSNQQQQRETQFVLTGIEAQILSLQSRLGLTPDQAYAASALSADPIISDLRAKIYQAEAQMKLLTPMLRSEHPSLLELQTQLDTYNQLLRSRVAEVIGGNGAGSLLGNSIFQASSLDPARQELASLLVNLQTQQETLQQQLNNLLRTEQRLRQEYANIPNKQLEQQRLEQQVTLKRAFYDQIQARLADVTLAQEETVGSLVLVQEPQTEVQIEPKPSGLVILLVGVGMGLCVGGGLIFLLDALDSKFYTVEDLQTALRQQEVPILGVLPTLPWGCDTEHLPIIDRADSPYLEPFERLRSNLRRSAISGKTTKTVLITSVFSEEGKTFTAYNLAIASARAGKRTLIIEANLRSPSQAAVLNIMLDPDPALEPLQYYETLSNCMHLVPEIENLYIVPSVDSLNQEATILESGEMRRLLEDARGRFDLVILDTPSLSRCNDALLLAPYTDGLLLTTRPGYTEEGPLVETIQELLETEETQLLGAVITTADLLVLFCQEIFEG
jgi:capsular exopolysaccharide synthesis family protein